MSFVETARTVAGYLNPSLPFPFNYIPLFFRLLSVLLAAPFLVFIALDLIAYAIARTLHLSMSQLRVPRSPPSVPRELVADDKDDDDFDSPIVDGLESSTGSPVARTRKLEEGSKGQAATGPSLASRLILPISSLVVVLAIFLQLTSSTNNVKNSTRLAALNGEAPPYALILTAHPDDEVMFFAPTILNLVATGWSILGVCLSSGNADGLGSTRVQELYDSYRILGVPQDQVVIVEHPQLQDSLTTSWDGQVIFNDVLAPLLRKGITHIITFDKQGVSGHPNHVSLSTVNKFFPEDVKYLPEFITLESPSLAAKYTSALWAAFYALRDWARIEEPVEPGLGLTFIASPSQYLRGVRAMLAHETQMVWFRWLYISFSQLMWVNQLVSN
ncbi:N-acetylglucosaminyl-phosphatidylinositol de-N-acetylase [Vanrija pseudolonga]|uniref:N-acetylglucosaminylphosphatidylinositol deacetylase n=1 Tax=Vanrija pseudolonga TaxID=143232 RepID=A0AAF1BEP4_9TREE|nr:N-acetylglucosaminyl-phosphatidylinositol de-N-acetylase [Vanrija pseudolonga]